MANGMVNVQDHGAVGDGTTDDLAAINTAIAAAGADEVVWFPFTPDGYLVSDTVAFPTGQAVMCDGPIVKTINIGGIVTHGEAGVLNAMGGKFLRIWAKYTNVGTSTGDWTNATSCCVTLYNVYRCPNIEIPETIGGYSGLRIIADVSFGYNKISCGAMRNHHRAIYISTSGGGWCNQNYWSCNMVNVATSVKTGVDRHAVWVDDDGSNPNNNANYWIGPGVELSPPTTEDATPFVLLACNDWIFRGVRTEKVDANYIARVGGSATEGNYIELMHQDGDAPRGIDMLSTLSSQTVPPLTLVTRKEIGNGWTKVWDSGYLPAKSTNRKMVGFSSTAATDGSRGTTLQFAELTATYVTPVNYAPTIRVTFGDGHKMFRVRRNSPTGSYGDVSFKCFNASDAELTDADTSRPISLGTWSGTRFGGSWGSGSTSQTIDVMCRGVNSSGDDEVAYVEVFFGVYGTTSQLDNVSIDTFGQSEIVVSPGQHDYRHRLSAATRLNDTPPTQGVYNVGDIVNNDAISSGEPIGWVCSVAGEPGTWLVFGTIA